MQENNLLLHWWEETRRQAEEGSRGAGEEDHEPDGGTQNTHICNIRKHVAVMWMK